MKRIVIVLFALFCCVGIKESAAQKFGHVNFAELYKQVPGRDVAEAEYEKYYMEIKQQVEAMENELQQKKMEFDANSANMTSLIKTAKQRELEDLYARYQEFGASVSADLQAKEVELSEPLIAKARKAVEDVAKEHGFTYIFNSSDGLVLYATPSDDVMELALKKLGVN
jgi:outer membrane protein